MTVALSVSGPPESMREHVVAASKAMKMGDWRTCHSFIINEKMNSKVWDLFPETQRVREMLVRSANIIFIILNLLLNVNFIYCVVVIYTSGSC